MLDICLKAFNEKIWRTQNFDFISLKSSSPSFWVALTHPDINEFSNFLLQFKNQKSRRKTVYGFSVIFILTGFMTF